MWPLVGNKTEQRQNHAPLKVLLSPTKLLKQEKKTWILTRMTLVVPHDTSCANRPFWEKGVKLLLG